MESEAVMGSSLQPGQVGIIVAVAKNGIIGGDNSLLWRLPADMAYFKEKTMGYPVIMGRKTYQSVGKLLPGRQTVVISRQEELEMPEGVVVKNSLDEALDQFSEAGCFVIGGGQIYQLALERTDIMYITEVDLEPDGDIFFHYNPGKWQEVEREERLRDEQNQCDFTFRVLKRKKP